MGFLKDYSENSKPTYDVINQDMLLELGIEGIIGFIVVPLVNKRLGFEVLNRFRRHWERGQIPDKEYLKDKKVYQYRTLRWGGKDVEENREVIGKYPALIFLEINETIDFVDRWTVFAGLWFETIEPLITRDEKEKLEKVIEGMKGEN